jgi:hypothetical protein
MKQLLFYEQANVITPARHGGWTLELGHTFGFAAAATTLPIMASEFAQAAPHAPIVFLLQEDAVVPVIVCGVDKDRCLFVAHDGTWTCPFVPAVLKRYPFVFTQSEDKALMTLCIDEAFSGIDRKGKKGERLFDAEGKRTAFLDRVLSFVSVYQREHQATLAFAKRLHELGLLEPAEARLTPPEGATTRAQTWTGFHRVSREKLAALEDREALDLFRSGGMELVHLHLLSMNAFAGLPSKAG